MCENYVLTACPICGCDIGVEELDEKKADIAFDLYREYSKWDKENFINFDETVTFEHWLESIYV